VAHQRNAGEMHSNQEELAMSNVIDISHFLPQPEVATTITTSTTHDESQVDDGEQQSDDSNQEGAS
jgi:hypothetical protein